MVNRICTECKAHCATTRTAFETAPCAGRVLACAVRKLGLPRQPHRRRLDNFPCRGRSGMVKSREHPALLDPVKPSYSQANRDRDPTLSRPPSGSTQMRKSWHDTSLALLQPPTTREAAVNLRRLKACMQRRNSALPGCPSNQKTPVEENSKLRKIARCLTNFNRARLRPSVQGIRGLWT